MAAVLAIPASQAAELKKVAFNHCPVRVVDAASDRTVSLTPVTVRGVARYRFYAIRPGKIAFSGRAVKLGTQPVKGKAVIERERYRAATFKAEFVLAGDGARQTFAAEVPESGFYMLTVSPAEDNGFELLESTVPVALAGGKSLRLHKPSGGLWFPVRGKDAFGVYLTASDNGSVSAELFDPADTPVWRSPAVKAREGHEATARSGALWRLRLAKPETGEPGEVSVDLLGDVPEFFPSKEKYWYVPPEPVRQSHAEAPRTLARPDLVERVTSGELKTAKASWWGFDPTNATGFLQAAIDSRVPRLVVDRCAAPWNVTTLFGVSDQTIELEEDVEIVALRGAFRHQDDVLFRFASCTNAALIGNRGSTLRMHRSDYHDKTKYVWSEWRHAVDLHAVSGFRLEGLTVAESGGDGLYLGVDWGHRNLGPCRDVTVRNCVFDRNYRQGISVISADNLLIEDTVMKNTWGTPPAAGIDFEPNRLPEQLTRCVMRNCLSIGNQSSGYEMFTAGLSSNSVPVDVTFENCRGEKNFINFYYLHHPRKSNGFSFPKGLVTLRNCTFKDGRWRGLRFLHAPACGIGFELHDCLLDNCSEPGSADIELLHQDDLPPTDGFLFDNLRIRRKDAGDWLTRSGTKLGAPENVRGNVTIERPDGEKQTVVLDEDWCRKYFRKPKQEK